MAGQSILDELWASPDGAPPPQLSEVLAQLQQFLDIVGYQKTSSALSKELARNGVTFDTEHLNKPRDDPYLLRLYRNWYSSHQSHLTSATAENSRMAASDSSGSSSDSDSSEGSASDSDSEVESSRDEAEGVLVDVEAEETSDDDSDEDSESSSGQSESDNESSNGGSSISSIRAGDKRKRSLSTPSSSDEDGVSSDDDTSGADEPDSDDDASSLSARPAKRLKTVNESSHASGSDVSSSAGSSSGDSPSSSDSDGSSSESSDDSSASPSDSDSAGKNTEGRAAESTGSSSASHETKRLASATKSRKKAQKKEDVDAGSSLAVVGHGAQSRDAGSTSSATLDVDSPADIDTPGQMHPDRLKQLPPAARGNGKKEVAELKKSQHVPFSRIPADQKVDPRFASNEYVSYDYADRAYQDLVVTKGKGFTKEKNKKKRGAYRGGAIDLTPKGIKFED